MWPSMKTTQGLGGLHNPSDQILLDWADSPSGSFDVPPSPPSLSSPSPSVDVLAQLKARRQMAELEKWLDEDEEGEALRMKDDPWKYASGTSKGALTGSPVDDEFPHATTDSGKVGFDDDFTAFVSAPPTDDDLEGESPTTPTFGRTGLSAPLAYHSLGSQSDLGESVHSDDEDLPSKDEIRQTAVRIFGQDAYGRDSAFLHAFEDAPDLPETFTFLDDNDSGDLGEFDLSRVLGALQGIKAEIATMDDEAERRRAAAKAALGLVYGLQQEQHQ